MDTDQALKLLKEYSGIDLKTVNSHQEKQLLIEALLFIKNLADDQNLGICAINSLEAFNTLQEYLIGLGYSYNINPDTMEVIKEPVYLKFSTERMAYSIDTYSGEYRGVLITIFADFNDKIVGTYGYLPLDLFS
jgi:hypothetical protein